MKADGLVVEFQKKGLATVGGTKFFLADGTELKGVISFEIPTSNIDSIRTVTVTLPLLDVYIID